jgi:hypothetical protein
MAIDLRLPGMLTGTDQRALLAAAVGVAILAAGCGGEDEASEPVLAPPRALEDPGPSTCMALA